MLKLQVKVERAESTSAACEMVPQRTGGVAIGHRWKNNLNYLAKLFLD